MSKEELKDKYTERAKIFHQAMVSCHRISPIDCIEWFADRIADLEKENAELKKLKRECETSLCRAEYQYNYEQLTKAKEIIKELYEGLDKLYLSGLSDKQIAFIERLQDKVEQFLKGVEK